MSPLLPSSGFGRRLSLIVTLALGLVAVSGLSSCSRLKQTSDQAQVAQAFNDWKSAVIAGRMDQALVYIPKPVEDYLKMLNTTPVNPAPIALSGTTPSAPPSASPGVDLLLRTALARKVPADLRTHLTLATLLQRISDRHLFNPRDVRQIDLGAVAIDGKRATAEVYYQGTLTALRLPFLKEGGGWKIDVMALLPYAEVLMRVDRAIKDETQAQQVDQLVSKLPSL
jgi:hypothetical protein